MKTKLYLDCFSESLYKLTGAIAPVAFSLTRALDGKLYLEHASDSDPIPKTN